MNASRNYIVIDGAEWAVTIDTDAEYVGDPLEVRGTEKVITAADCPCGDTSWSVERRGYCGENVFIQCECGKEYPLEYRKTSLRNVSSVYLEVVNLCNAAKDHKRIGCDKDCHTSLYLFHQTARARILDAPTSEREELSQRVQETDWL